MSRFDYVKYDDSSLRFQIVLKTMFEELDRIIEANVEKGRAKALIFTRLEEAYMWCGKAIRDDQIKRNGSAEPQEERGNE